MIKPCEQTHFIGVTVSGQLAETVSSCRRWMHERFGCKSGHQTPPHVTLIPPFIFPDERRIVDLELALEGFIHRQKPFDGRFRGFGAFAERTVFVRVEPDPRWNAWHESVTEAVINAFPDLIHRDKRPFTPHLTVSNRDIPLGAVPAALSHFDTLDLDVSIPIDHVVLFERTGTRWDIRNGWYAP